MPLRFESGERQISGETLVVDETGPCLFVATTTLPALGLSLTSSYLGHDAVKHTLVGELVQVGDARPDAELSKRWVGTAAGVFTYERRALLYDHLQRVQDVALSRCGVNLRVLGSARAAQALDPLAAR